MQAISVSELLYLCRDERLSTQVLIVPGVGDKLLHAQFVGNCSKVEAV